MVYLFCIVAVGQQVLSTPEADLVDLTRGVKKISQVGSPGIVSAISDQAVPFIAANEDGDRAMAVAGRLGKGRIIAIGHDGYLSKDAVKRADNGRLLVNMVEWASRRRSQIKVGTLNRQTNGVGFALGLTEVPVTPRSLAEADVVLVNGALDPALARDYVQKGGGLIVGQTPWGWKMVHKSTTLLRDFEWNELLADAGIVFSDGIVGNPRPLKTLEESNKVNSSMALQHIESDPNAVALISAAIRDCPERTQFAKDLAKKVKGAEVKVPTVQNPIRVKDGMGRLAIVVREMDRQMGRPTPRVEPASATFPGAVPASEKRVTRDVMIPVDDAQWASTGLYAAPGDNIEVTLPPALVGKGLTLQIGVHSDTIWHMDKWERYPSVVARRAFDGNSVDLYSPFGGLIVIDVPRNLKLPAQKITVSGGVVSPRFVLGQTTNDQWKSSLKSQAPWAELQSKHLILSVPTEEARKVQDPTRLMKFWDRVMALYPELDGSPFTIRPERIVADRQISLGYMHSGYPIMTWMDDSVPLSLSYERMSKNGTWGHWHELGHNRQQEPWTFDGTVEVTNNVYVLYVYNKICGKSVFDRVKSDQAKVDRYLAAPNFEVWKDEPFVALTMYAQLIDAFGWDAYKKLMREYLDAPAEDLPKNDDEKRDQLMVRYSRQVGRNLAPFFAKWGVPVSEAAKAKIQSLPAWSGKV